MSDLQDLVRRSLAGDQDAVEELGMDLDDTCLLLCDEIDTLKAEIAELKEEVAWFANKPDGQAHEIERLKAELGELQNRQLGVVVVPREREEGCDE